MKKCRIAFVFVFWLSIIFLSCTKTGSDLVIYGPPVQTISFSDVSDLIIDSTGKSVSIKAHIDAVNGLRKVEVQYQPWNVSVVLSQFANPNSFLLDVPVTIPVNAALKIHSIIIKAEDAKGDSSFTEVKIGLQDLNYSKLYMTDISDPALLVNDLFGVPIVMDKIGSHIYQLVYYARTDGVSVRFVPDKKSFSPVAIGLDPANSERLITDGSKSLPIQLGAKGYYKVTVNTLLLSYQVESFSPTGNAFNEVALVGRGFYDNPNMNWQNALPDIILLDKDPSNPFLFSKIIKLGIPPGQSYNSAQFILTTNNGWTNFWRFDNGSSPELAVFNGGTNTDIPITSSPVSYLFLFDSFTGRVQAIKQ